MESLEKKVHVFMGEDDYSAKSAELNNINGSLEEEEEEDYDDSENSSVHHHHDPHRTLYWESQEALLQETLERYSVIGWKLREEIVEMMKVVKNKEFCKCSMPNNASCCSHCLRKSMVAMLSHAGYNATLCFSKWEHTKKFPGGSHEYIEVIMGSKQAMRKKQTLFLIELELRDQFEIARASEEYKKLVSILPEFYVGKPEYLIGITRLMCDAAKRSMKEKKIHMGPWRKNSFMQMKWSASSSTSSSSTSYNNRNWGLNLDFKPLHITTTAAPVVVT